MAIQQIQAYCRQCGQATLHVRHTYQVPHLGHLLATIFLCGFWLPIWILHILIDTIAGKPPYLCQRCGEPAALPASVGAWIARVAILVVLLGLVLAALGSVVRVSIG